MNKRVPKDLAASVRNRLFKLSQERNEPFEYVLTRYATERLLYRLSRSPFANRFVLKGPRCLAFGMVSLTGRREIWIS